MNLSEIAQLKTQSSIKLKPFGNTTFYCAIPKGFFKMPRKLNPNTYHGWRRLVLIRDSYKCVICGCQKNIEVDHIKPVKTHAHLIYDINNGRVLCNPCHKKTDTYGGKMLKGTRRKEVKYGSR